MEEPDFIPEDGKVCTNCVFYHMCPYWYNCKTLERVTSFTGIEKYVRYGDSTEKVR